jgi:hypothetical protein
VLAPLLLVELALAFFFFPHDLLSFALPLFLSGAFSTIPAYALILHRWPNTVSAWSRFGLALACAFVAFQVSLVIFSIYAGLGARANPLPFLAVVLLAANVFFFPAWILLGVLAYLLVRLTNRPPSPAQRGTALRRPNR